MAASRTVKVSRKALATAMLNRCLAQGVTDPYEADMVP